MNINDKSIEKNSKKAYIVVGYKSIVKEAEKTAADIIAEANANRDLIIAEAKSEAEKVLGSAKVTLEENNKSLQKYKQDIDNYNDKSQKYWSELCQLIERCKNELDRKTSTDISDVPKLYDYTTDTEQIPKPYDPETATAPPTGNDVPKGLTMVEQFHWMRDKWGYYNSAQKRKIEAARNSQKPTQD